MNNQQSPTSIFSRAIEWISHAIQPVKNIFVPTVTQNVYQKNSLKYSNIAYNHQESRSLGLKHVREGLKKGAQGDKRRRIENKIKKISQYWSKKIEHQQKPLQLICPICMDFLVGSVSTKCGHTFCWQCIDEATLLNQGCPVCRRQIQGSEFTLCFQLCAIVKRYLKRSSSEFQCDNELLFNTRLDQFEEWLSLKLLKASRVHPSDLVDIRDTQNIWCSGLIKQVMKIQGKLMLHVHYIGWSSVYDQIIPIQSQRLATYKFYSTRKDIPHYELPQENQEILQGYVIQRISQAEDQELSESQEDEREQQQCYEQLQQSEEVVEYKEEYECEMPSSKALNCFYNPQE